MTTKKTTLLTTLTEHRDGHLPAHDAAAVPPALKRLEAREFRGMTIPGAWA